MKYSALVHGKYMQVAITKKAANELTRRPKPTVAIVHLIFGCMVAKRVWFSEVIPVDAIEITDSIFVCFDVVRYANCSLTNIDGGAEPEPFPLQRDIKKFVPDQLAIDFRSNKLSGEFEYTRGRKRLEESFDIIETSSRADGVI